VLLEEWQDANLPRASAGLSTDAQQQHLSVPLQQQLVVIIQQQGKQHALRRTSLVSAQWSPPSSGRYKCNVDAAFSERFWRGKFCSLVKYIQLQFVLAKVLQFGQIYPIAIGEALGLYHVIHWMQDMRFDNIDFELTRDAFHSRTVDVTEFGTVIGACQHLFSSSFTNSRVEFIRRQANTATHALAREATSLASPTIYYAIPHCIKTIIINEML